MTVAADAQEALERAAPWIERLARVGFVAKGVAYVVTGYIAARAAMGVGHATGSRGAFRVILDQPFGRVMLWAVVVGLAGYGLWRLISAATDSERRGTKPKGIALRIGHAASGVGHLLFAADAVSLLRGTGGSGDGNSRGLVAHGLAAPFGRWLVVGAGIGIIGYGLWQLYKAAFKDLEKHLRMRTELTHEQCKWLVRIGRFGTGARGAVFVLIGVFAARAGWAADPSRAGGLSEALRSLEAKSYTPVVLGSIAVGLIAYGIFQFVCARYRVVNAT